MAETDPLRTTPAPARGGSRRPLRLPPPLLRKLGTWSIAGHPHEVCGLLIGTRTAGDVDVRHVTRARNLARERLRDRYILDPGDYLAADMAARRDGLDVVGVWHTHPDHPARPSATDLEAAWVDFTYVILSVRAGAVVEVRAWCLQGAAFIEQTFEEVRT